jgi:hypothetical protein
MAKWSERDLIFWYDSKNIILQHIGVCLWWAIIKTIISHFGNVINAISIKRWKVFIKILLINFYKNYPATYLSLDHTLNGLIFCNSLLIWLHLAHSHKRKRAFFHVLIYSIQGWTLQKRPKTSLGNIHFKHNESLRQIKIW